jgi:hypothetical protein
VINLQSAGLRLVCISNCTTSPVFGVQFAITTFGQRSHPDVPAEFDVLIDVNNDGTYDLDVFNADIGQLTAGVIANLSTNTASGPYFYTVADLDSANAVLTVPLSALTSAAGNLNVNTPFTFEVLAFDNYFTGNLTDLIPGMKYELDMPKVYANSATYVVPAGGTSAVTVFPNNAASPYLNGPYNGNSPSQLGVLFLYTYGKTGQEGSSVIVLP